jgi:hypothetical protein
LCGNKDAFLYIFLFYYIYNFCKIVSWAGEGEYPGKLLARNRYTNGRIPGLGKGNILVNSGLGTGTLTGFQRPWKNSGLGKGEYLGKLRAGKQGHQRVTNICGEFRAGAR